MRFPLRRPNPAHALVRGTRSGPARSHAYLARRALRIGAAAAVAARLGLALARACARVPAPAARNHPRGAWRGSPLHPRSAILEERRAEAVPDHDRRRVEGAAAYVRCVRPTGLFGEARIRAVASRRFVRLCTGNHEDRDDQRGCTNSSHVNSTSRRCRFAEPSDRRSDVRTRTPVRTGGRRHTGTRSESAPHPVAVHRR